MITVQILKPDALSFSTFFMLSSRFMVFFCSEFQLNRLSDKTNLRELFASDLKASCKYKRVSLNAWLLADWRRYKLYAIPGTQARPQNP